MKHSFSFKAILSIIIFCLTITSNQLFAQISGTGIFFQAVARDNSSNAAKDRKIYVQAGIRQYTATGTVVLNEEFETNTDATGVFSISLGLGRRIGGIVSNLQNVDWANGPYFLNLKIAITPIAPITNWDYTKDLIDLGTTPFGTVPYALFAGSVYGFDQKLNITDTLSMLKDYAKIKSIKTLDSTLLTKLSISDTAAMLARLAKSINYTNPKVALVDSGSIYITPTQLAAKIFDITPINISLSSKLNKADSLTSYVTPSQLAAKTFDLAPIINHIGTKLNITDTSLMLTTRIARDTIALSNRINLKENSNNKSIDINNINDLNDTKYPSVKAVKFYVDAAVASVVVTDGSITSQKLANDAITDIKIAPGISSSKVGLGNVTNNAQIYSLNGLSDQVQTFSIGSLGTAPSFSSSSATHTLHIPMASSTSVIAGLLSNTDWTTFNNKLSSFTEIDPIVRSINGIVKSDGTSISAATSGTDYLSPTGSALNLTNFPILNQNTTGSAAGLTAAYINWNASTGGASILNKPILFSGAYADLTGTPSLFSGSYNDLSNKPSLFSGAYSDLTSKPTLFSGSYNDLSNKPNLFSGAYSDLTSKPTLFSGAYADLSGLPTLTSGTVTSVSALTIGATGTDISSTVANGTTTPTITLNIPTASITNRGLLSATDWSTFYSKGDMTLGGIQTVTGSKTFSNTIVGSINGNAATATKLATPVTINGTSFDGSTNISFSTNTANALTYNNGGAGDASGNTFNGSAAKTISYNSIGAAPLAGSTSITTLGTIATGTWNASTISVAKGGTGATTLTANGLLIGNGTSAVNSIAPSTNGNVLTSNGTIWVSSSPSITLIRDIADEFAATTSQTSFTLTQTPSVNSKVKMYVNGVRISNTAYSLSGTTITYNATNNGAYTLTASDRIQFDYYY